MIMIISNNNLYKILILLILLILWLQRYTRILPEEDVNTSKHIELLYEIDITVNILYIY